MKEQINMVYIDDSPDVTLEEYLDNYVSDEYEMVFESILYRPEEGYDSLLNDPKVQRANIVFIDSKLFENRTRTNERVQGEQIKLVMKNIFPYIEVVIVTQNEMNPDIQMIEKYKRSNTDIQPQQYYSNIIPSYINDAIIRIKENRIIGQQFSENENWDKLLKDRILAALKGSNKYEGLNKADIDELVNAFKRIQEKLDA